MRRAIAAMATVCLCSAAACSSGNERGSSGSDGSGRNSGRGGATGGVASGSGGLSTEGAGGATASGTGGTPNRAGAAATGAGGATGNGNGGASNRAGAAGASAGGSTASGAGGTSSMPTHADIKAKIAAFKASHSGNGGKDWDINAMTPAQVAADPAASELLALCGKGERPVIPSLAWEYGGSDHQWINPDASALVYCVYIPVSPGTAHWSYDATADHVTADVYVRFPEENPCKDKPGPDQVMACLGDPTNIEILVDTASLNDGADVGLDVSNASTELRLVQPDGTTIHLADNA